MSMLAIIAGLFFIGVTFFILTRAGEGYLLGRSADFGFPTWQDINGSHIKYIPVSSRLLEANYLPTNEWGRNPLAYNPFLQRPLMYQYPINGILSSPYTDCFLAPSHGRCHSGFRKIGARCCKRNDLDLYEP